MHVVNHVLRQFEFRSILNSSQKLDKLSWIRRKFESFLILSLNCHFWGENDQSDNKVDQPDFYKLTLYMDFVNFPKKTRVNS